MERVHLHSFFFELKRKNKANISYLFLKFNKTTKTKNMDPSQQLIRTKILVLGWPILELKSAFRQRMG